MNRFYFLTIALICSSLALVYRASAQEENSGGQVLDFNADIIEGELKKPKLFLELGGTLKDFDSVLLSRDDFNDYHEIDMRKRLRYVSEK